MCVAAAIAGAAVVGAGATVYSANKASSSQQNAANQANSTQLAMYNQTRADQTPWRVAGGNAVGALSSYYGLPGADGSTPDAATTAANDNALIQSLPGYQFNLQQGNQAVQRDLAAKGLLGSGAAGKALTQYGQGYAQNAANSYLNGLQSLAGLGQTSAQATGAAGQNAANQIGSNQIYAGNAQASGYANASNAVNSGLSGLSGIYSNYALQQQYANGGYGAPGSYAISSPPTYYGGYNGSDPTSVYTGP
jgi:hypothetical protein